MLFRFAWGNDSLRDLPLGVNALTQRGEARPQDAHRFQLRLIQRAATQRIDQRVELSGSQRITYTQGWDRENRLTTVTNTATSPNVVNKFIYDGDPTPLRYGDFVATAPKVQLVISGTSILTTAYASALEVAISSTARMTKTYYSAGSQLVAMRVITSPLTPGTLYFMHSDHLGSSSLTTDANGNVVARQLYDAWGNVRYVNGLMPTDIGFTGQHADSTGLSYFHARYYSGVLGRFVSADSIVPGAADGSGGGGVSTLGYDKNTRLTPLTTDFHEFIDLVGGENREVLQYGPFFQWDDKVKKDHPAPMGPMNPQALNRFAYGLNSPLKYADPSGHCVPWCVLGFIGAIAGAIGSVVSQVANGTGTLGDRLSNVDLGNVAVAAGVGFVAGATGGLVTTGLGAFALGADAAVTQYALTQAIHNQPITPVGVVANIIVGGTAGRLIGPAPQVPLTTMLYDTADRALSQSLNNRELLKVIFGGNLVRSLFGGLISNTDIAGHQ